MPSLLRRDPPDGLTEAGAAAWGRGLRAIEGRVDPDLYLDLVVRYARTVQLAEDTRAAWITDGMMLTVEYSNGALAVNPLLRLLREAELDAARFGKMLGIDATAKGRAGRPAEAVFRPGAKSTTLEASPKVAKLRRRARG